MLEKENYLNEFYKSIELESYGLEREIFYSKESMFNKIVIQKIIKYFHSIKGISKFLGMELIYKIASETEKLLKKVYDGEIEEENILFEIVSDIGTYFEKIKNKDKYEISLKKGNLLFMILSFINENGIEMLYGKCIFGTDKSKRIYYSGIMGEMIFEKRRDEIEKTDCMGLFGRNIFEFESKETVNVKKSEKENLIAEIEILKTVEENFLFTVKIVSKEKDKREEIWKSKNNKMKKAYEMAKLASQNSSTVLITGETGAGKEIIADMICRLSGINEEKIVKINCGAISQNLLESELFGYEKGAFTGAVSSKKGYFEMADGGIIFLDEVGEIDKNIQIKLLRVIQEGEFYRVGGTKQKKVKVKIIAATNKELKKEVEEGNMREDLYYRLNVYNINLPPLRERKEDLEYLISIFIEEFNKEYKKNIIGISEEAKKVLMDYNYKGNIRELKNIIEYIFINGAERVVEYEDLPYYLREKTKSEEKYKKNIKKEILTLEEVEREHIKKVFEIFKGNKMRSARALDIDVRRLSRLLEKHEII